MKEIIERLKERFDISNVHAQRDDLSFITIQKNHLTSALSYLKECLYITYAFLYLMFTWSFVAYIN